MEESVKTQYRLLIDRYGKMEWTHKIQEKQADINIEKANSNKNWMAIWATLTSTTAIATMLSTLLCKEICLICTAIFAAGSAYCTLRCKDGTFETKADANRRYAAKCRTIRNQYASLLADIKSERISSLDQIADLRNQIERNENILFEGEVAPPTSSEACKRAEVALKQNKESITEPDEIESILPDYLRI